MRSLTWSRGIVWSIVLTWPWLLWASAKTSPGMILRGIPSDSSAVMPVLADIVLCLGAMYAVKSRRGLRSRTDQTSNSLYAGPHFSRVRKATQAKSRPHKKTD